MSYLKPKSKYAYGFAMHAKEILENAQVIYNDNQKSGYFNNPVYDNDFKHDWNWNPIKKCETFQDWYDMETITVGQVKKSIDQMIANQK